jgi:hypothetical protein
LLAAAKAKNIATLSAAPFGGAILATGSGGDLLYTFAPALPEVVEAVQRMERRCAELGVSIAVAGQIDPALSGGPDFLAAWPPERRPSREQLQARWSMRPEPAQR